MLFPCFGESWLLCAVARKQGDGYPLIAIGPDAVEGWALAYHWSPCPGAVPRVGSASA